MSLNEGSEHYNAFYDHVLGKKKLSNNYGKVYDIIDDISSRRGIKNEWEAIDADIQDEIIEKWNKILTNKRE